MKERGQFFVSFLSGALLFLAGEKAYNRTANKRYRRGDCEYQPVTDKEIEKCAVACEQTGLAHLRQGVILRVELSDCGKTRFPNTHISIDGYTGKDHENPGHDEDQTLVFHRQSFLPFVGRQHNSTAFLDYHNMYGSGSQEELQFKKMTSHFFDIALFACSLAHWLAYRNPVFRLEMADPFQDFRFGD
jgi:hypothetical protein